MKKFLIVLMAAIFCLSLVCERVEARAGFRSGRSSLGYRGSRTYTPPAKPQAPNQTQQQQTATAPSQPPAYQPQPPMQQPGMGGGFGRSLFAGLAGGFIGSLLFSSLGYGATAPGSGGFGFLEILLAGLGIFLLIKFLRPKKAAAPGMADEISPSPDVRGVGLAGDDFLKDLKRADTTFDPEAFRNEASDVFMKVQNAWKKRDLAPVEKLFNPDLFYAMKRELERMTGEGSVSHIEKIQIKDVAITEAWQEEGLDYVTVRISVVARSLSTDAEGRTVEEGGAQTAFVEYWTFVREIWLGGWKLTAIQQESL